MNKNNKDNYYCDKDELWEAIEDYYDQDDVNIKSGGDGIVISNRLGLMINAIAEKMMSSRNFANYPYRGQMVGDAVLRMITVISDRKFNLWREEQTYNITKRVFKGYRYSDKVIESDILDNIKNGDVKYVVVNEPDGVVKTMVKNTEDKFIVDENGEFKPAMVYEGFENNIYERTDRDEDIIEVDSFVELQPVRGKIPNEMLNIVNGKGEQLYIKNNAFGYLSLVSNREALTRIKKENRQYNAVHEFQEQEFTKFLSENPEMAPQRVTDDTYDID